MHNLGHHSLTFQDYFCYTAFTVYGAFWLIAAAVNAVHVRHEGKQFKIDCSFRLTFRQPMKRLPLAHSSSRTLSSLRVCSVVVVERCNLSKNKQAERYVARWLSSLRWRYCFWALYCLLLHTSLRIVLRYVSLINTHAYSTAVDTFCRR